MTLIIKTASGMTATYADVKSAIGKVLWPAQSIATRLTTTGTLLRIDRGFCGVTFLLSANIKPCEDL
jgi:hypothetical protein